MKSGIPRRVLGLILAASIALVAIGLMPESAKAVTTTYVYRQVKWLKSQVASIKSVNTSQASAIAWLKSQISSLRSSDASQGAAIDGIKSVNASQSDDLSGMELLNATQTSDIAGVQERVVDLEASRTAQASFWPNLALGIASEMSSDGGGVVYTLIDVPVTCLVDGIAQQGWRGHLVIHAPEGDYKCWAPSATATYFRVQTPNAIWDNNSTLEVEYWLEWGGVLVHGTRTLAKL